MCDFSAYGGPSEEWLQVETTLPAPNPNLSLDELVRTNNDGRDAASKKAMETLASKVVIRDHTIPTRDGHTIQARSYRPSSVPPTTKLPVFIYFHGGGFLFGTLSSEDATCTRIIASGTSCIVLNVNYRHTPQHTYPTAWNDSEDALEWLHAHLSDLAADGTKVIVGGSSAGACLTSSLVLRQSTYTLLAAHLPKPLGQILLIPWLVFEASYEHVLAQLRDPSVSSYKQNEFAPILPLTRTRMFTELLQIPAPVELSDRRLNAGLATVEEVKTLPPTVFGIAGLDPLRDEGLLYAKKLAENGVPTTIHLFKGVPHGFRRFGDRLSASKHLDDAITGGIDWILSDPVASNEFEVKVW